jgi:hypothetical protein
MEHELEIFDQGDAAPDRHEDHAASNRHRILLHRHDAAGQHAFDNANVQRQSKSSHSTSTHCHARPTSQRRLRGNQARSHMPTHTGVTRHSRPRPRPPSIGHSGRGRNFFDCRSSCNGFAVPIDMTVDGIRDECQGDVMNVAARIALTAGGLALGAGSVYGLSKIGGASSAERAADIGQRSDQAQGEWDDFKTALEAEFPNMELDSRADHARLDQFLQQHPAPSWINVEHEGFTRVHLSTNGFLPNNLRPAIQEEIAYPIGFGGFMALGGAAGAVMGVAKPPASTLGVLGATLGAGLLVSMGIGGILGGLQTNRFDSNFDHSTQIVRDINTHR